MNRKIKALVVYAYMEDFHRMRLAIQQHITMLESLPDEYEITYLNVYKEKKPADQDKFEIVLLHTTFLGVRWSDTFYSLKWKFRWVAELKGIKLAFPQDEYDHSELLDEWLYEMKVDVVFSCFGESQREILYPIMSKRATFVEILTGYFPHSVVNLNTLPLKDRPFDVVYRATKLPFWFGSHGQLKHNIAERISQRCLESSLNVNISTRVEDTITGQEWLEFLASGKVVIGCESGSSVLDRRGEIKSMIQYLEKGNPQLSFNEASGHMPLGWDNYSFFAISPRHLEAIRTKTCQVLVEGSYSGVLKSGLHYISLARDFSNLDSVIEQIKDQDYIQKIADQAYEDIFLNGGYTYKEMTNRLSRIIRTLL